MFGLFINGSRTLVLGFALAVILAGCSLQRQGISTPVPGMAAPEEIVNPTQGAVDPAAQVPAVVTPLVESTPVTDAPRPHFPKPEEEPIPMPLMGTEIHAFDVALQQRLEESGFDLVRKNSLMWSLVEPTEGSREWGQVASLEGQLAAFSEMGIESILIVRSTPIWAQQIYGKDCGPVTPEKLEAFANFLHDAVARYSIAPYNIKYWELGNEPDVDPTLVPVHTPFGCWGNINDEYYGGREYGDMLKVVYPAMKAANPEIQVLIGGLLLDCDPTNPPEGKDCKPARYLEGILEAGAGDSFDVVSFHGYYHFWGSMHPEERMGSFAPRGGAVIGRANFLREVLGNYGYEKSLMHTEGALLCPLSGGGATNRVCNPIGPDYFEAQADYVVWLYIRNWAAGIDGTIWYHMEGPGWNQAGLLQNDRTPRPAFRAFQFLREYLDGMGFARELMETDTDLRVFEFKDEHRLVWVAWSVDEVRQLFLPEGVVQVFDKYGNNLPFEGQELTVQSPVYIEMSIQDPG